MERLRYRDNWTRWIFRAEIARASRVPLAQCEFVVLTRTVLRYATAGAFEKAASENLAGGFVCFLSSFNSSNDKTSSSERWGKMSSLGFLVLSLEILVYPSKTISLPLAVNVYLSNAIFADVERYSASGI